MSSPDDSDTLVPPPLEVLLNPHHIVVCSFLGEESLASIQWLILPLRSAYNAFQPPITILDTAEPSPAFFQVLAAFADVVCISFSVFTWYPQRSLTSLCHIHSTMSKEVLSYILIYSARVRKLLLLSSYSASARNQRSCRLALWMRIWKQA